MNQRLKFHLLFWLVYLVFESYIEFAWISSSFASMSIPARFLMAMLEESTLLLVKLPFVYAVFYLVYTVAGKYNKVALALGAGMLGFAAAVVLHRLLVVFIILPYIYRDGLDTSMLFNTNRIISAVIDLLFLAGMAIVAKQYRMHQQWKEREKGLVKEKLVAELKFLRTQTNPHFLFNTLNNIYGLARKKSDDTADVVMKLSKLLRFMLYESKKDTIGIAEELRVLADYIELEKIRYSERLAVSFEKSIDDESARIAPLILLPFVENAFKHGASQARFETFISIDARLQNGQLHFVIANSKDDDGELEIQENIGLSNVRRQLELMYPDHLLQLKNEPCLFTATLTINLNHHATI